jgi:protein-S-isoprenylcysteine O-methyltransferase Ste14
MATKFTPPDMILVFVGLEIFFHYLFPIKQIVTSPYNYLGILLIILGVIPNFWIYSYFKRKSTTTKIYENPKVLVTSGLFKISRNPNYLGMAVLLLGIALLLGSLITFVFPILFIILTDIFVIRKEEKNLEKIFRKRYLEYKNKVRRWI